MNFEMLAQGIAEMREAFRAMVAGLVEDGFTDAQARELVVAIMKNHSDDDDDD